MGRQEFPEFHKLKILFDRLKVNFYLHNVPPCAFPIIREDCIIAVEYLHFLKGIISDPDDDNRQREGRCLK